MSEKGNIIANALSKYGKGNRHKVRNRLLIANKISRRIFELDMTKREFADKIGKSVLEVSDILSGYMNLTIDTMSDIEQVLDIRLLNTIRTD